MSTYANDVNNIDDASVLRLSALKVDQQQMRNDLHSLRKKISLLKQDLLSSVQVQLLCAYYITLFATYGGTLMFIAIEGMYTSHDMLHMHNMMIYFVF